MCLLWFVPGTLFGAGCCLLHVDVGLGLCGLVGKHVCGAEVLAGCLCEEGLWLGPVDC
jgi:hypothetical protein